MTSNTPSIFTVILAWNQLQETLACLDSLSQTRYPNVHFLLVDNGSTDGTAKVVARDYPEVYVLRVKKNVGIAGGYNLGMEYALEHGAEYVMVMNNDTIVDPDMINHLVRAFEIYPSAGITIPKIYNYYGKPNRLWCVGAKWHRFPPRVKFAHADAPDGPQFNNIRSLEFAPSCCLLISREALKEIGLFDPNYYFYYDDWDFSARFRALGYKILFIPEAHLWHKVSASTMTSDKPGKWWFIMGQSSVRFFLRHKSPLVLGTHTIWFIFRESVKLKFNRVFAYIFGVVGGLANHWGWKP